jgi:hypothetical protein
MISHQQGAAAGLRQKNLILCEAKPAHIARLKQPLLENKHRTLFAEWQEIVSRF